MQSKIMKMKVSKKKTIPKSIDLEVSLHGINQKNCLIKSLIAIGIGILLFKLPILGLVDYNDFFQFIGKMLILGGIIFFFFSRKFQNLLISDEEIYKISTLNQITECTSEFKFALPKISLSVIFLITIIVGFLVNQFLMSKLQLQNGLNKPSINISITKKGGK